MVCRTTILEVHKVHTCNEALAPPLIRQDFKTEICLTALSTTNLGTTVRGVRQGGAKANLVGVLLHRCGDRPWRSMASGIGKDKFGDQVKMVAKLDMAILAAGGESGCMAFIRLKAEGKLQGKHTSASILIKLEYADV